VNNCKVTVKVQGENTVYSFEDHMTIGDLRRSIKEDSETGVLCRVVDEGNLHTRKNIVIR